MTVIAFLPVNQQKQSIKCCYSCGNSKIPMTEKGHCVKYLKHLLSNRGKVMAKFNALKNYDPLNICTDYR